MKKIKIYLITLHNGSYQVKRVVNSLDPAVKQILTTDEVDVFLCKRDTTVVFE